MAKKSASAKIREFITQYPNAKPSVVAAKLGVDVQYVYVVRSLMKKTITVTPDTPAPKEVNIDLVHTGTITNTEPAPPAQPDMVNNPPHYKTGGIETIDFIEAKGLDYHLGNVVKYVTRAGKKGDETEDLKKAFWYLSRAIDMRENAQVNSSGPV